MQNQAKSRGPLSGVRIVELAGIGPAPMCAMFLADLGATIIRVDRKVPSELGVKRPVQYDLGLRNRKSIRVDLKDPKALALVLKLIAGADGLIEGFRPGVTERLGLGPEACLARNPRLVYGRATGWGQTGPLAHSAGHDINYIAITGVLAATGRQGQPPTIPLNVVGDYAGGSLYLALGMVAAILEARSSGQGQVVDGAIVDGVCALQTVLVGMRQAGLIQPERGTNMLDTGAPFYEVYETADGQFISVGPVEDKFYRLLLERLGVDPAAVGEQFDRTAWPRAKRVLAAKFLERSRAEWTALLEGTDVCFAPVLDMAEAFEHPHLKARGSYINVDGVWQPGPGPQFSRTTLPVPEQPAPLTTENAVAALQQWLPPAEVAELAAAGTFV